MQRNNNNTKPKPTQPNYHYSQQNQSQAYYSSLASMGGTNGLPHQPPSNTQMPKNGQVHFLPRISGASAFSNYSNNTGNSTSINNKVR
jgi:hypothetical protein